MKHVITGMAALTCLFTSGVFAAGNGDGTVHFTGEIIDAPCVVSVDSQNQEVNLGQVKSSVFTAVGDKSTAKSFQIKLEECDISTMNTAHVVFSGNGDSDDATLVAINNEAGSASGVGIGIYDNAGASVALNSGETTETLKAGQTVLYYTARYVQSGDSVTTGYGNGEVDFNLTYE